MYPEPAAGMLPGEGVDHLHEAGLPVRRRLRGLRLGPFSIIDVAIPRIY